MNRYYEIATGKTPNITEIRELFSSAMSIPDGADLTDIGYAKLVEVEKPAANTNCKVVETTPENVGGIYYQRWQQVPFTAQELADAKATKNAEINAGRLTANRTSFAYAGKVIACDELSRSDIDAVAGYIALYGTFPDGFPMGWKATDNTYASLPNVAAFKDMYKAMVDQGNANFVHAQTLKAQVSAAATVDAVNAIEW